jgi:hypothetical protein
MLNNLEKNIYLRGGLGIENTKTISELVFTNTAIIYHESILTTLEKAQIITTFKDKGIDVQFRGPDYVMSRSSTWFRNHEKKQ